MRHFKIAVFFILLMSGAAFAADDSEYLLNATPEQARAYKAAHTGVFNEQGQRLGATIEEVQAKAQVEADARSAVWRQRMDAAASGHPDANFIADNKANHDLWASKNPAEAAAGNSRPITAEELTGMAAVRRIAAVKGDSYPISSEELAATIATINEERSQSNVGYAKPMTLQGTPVGLSGFDEPKPVPPASAPATAASASTSGEKAKSKITPVQELPKLKTLVSFEAKPDSASQ